jgi:hypothetical protein
MRLQTETLGGSRTGPRVVQTYTQGNNLNTIVDLPGHLRLKY